MRRFVNAWWIVLIGVIRQDECNLASDNDTERTLYNYQHLEDTNIDTGCDDLRDSACPCLQRNFKIKYQHNIRWEIYLPSPVHSIILLNGFSFENRF